MKSEIERKLDLWKSNANIIVPAVANDKGARYIKAQITADGVNFDIPNNSQVMLSVVKPDGSETLTAGVFSGSTVTVPLTNQTLAVPGFCEAAIKIIKGGNKISTTPFKLLILDEIIDDETVTSSDEFNALVSALSAVAEYENIGRNYPGSTHGEIFNDYTTNSSSGSYSSTSGKNNSTFGNYSQTTGNNNVNHARYSQLSGYNNTNGDDENQNVSDSGDTRTANCSTVSGSHNTNTGFSSKVSGGYNENSGRYNDISGYQNRSSANYQTVSGKYNIPISNALVIVGNGTESSRHNAYVLDNEGNATFSGRVAATSPADDYDLTTKAYTDFHISYEILQSEGRMRNEFDGKIASIPSITVDTELDEESENPVQNKAIVETLSEMALEISNVVDNKVDKEAGKSLMTDAEKTKLQSLTATERVIKREQLISANNAIRVEVGDDRDNFSLKKAKIFGLFKFDSSQLTSNLTLRIDGLYSPARYYSILNNIPKDNGTVAFYCEVDYDSFANVCQSRVCAKGGNTTSSGIAPLTQNLISFGDNMKSISGFNIYLLHGTDKVTLNAGSKVSIVGIDLDGIPNAAMINGEIGGE